MAVTKLAGSASLQFVRHTAVGVYIRRSRYAEVINRLPLSLEDGRLNFPRVTGSLVFLHCRQIGNTVRKQCLSSETMEQSLSPQCAHTLGNL